MAIARDEIEFDVESRGFWWSESGSERVIGVVRSGGWQSLSRWSIAWLPGGLGLEAFGALGRHCRWYGDSAVWQSPGSNQPSSSNSGDEESRTKWTKGARKRRKERRGLRAERNTAQLDPWHNRESKLAPLVRSRWTASLPSRRVQPSRQQAISMLFCRDREYRQSFQSHWDKIPSSTEWRETSSYVFFVFFFYSRYKFGGLRLLEEKRKNIPHGKKNCYKLFGELLFKTIESNKYSTQL